jgi:BREX protein BrxB
MTDWKERLTGQLEPVLRSADPRPNISAYHDMPYAIFRYPPEDEFEVRQEIALLRTRLEQAGKRVTMISLAECLRSALDAEGMGIEALVDAEKSVGLEPTIETIHQVLSEYRPLDELVAQRIPGDADPLRDVVLIVRAGALFPIYRTSSLLEQLKGKVHVPAVLCYPGELDGAAGLRFMGVLDAEHNYRPKIF